MKNIISIVIFFVFSIYISAQNQTINGNLNVEASITSKREVNVGEWTVADKTGLGSKLNFGGVSFAGDFIWMAKYVTGHEQTELRVNIGDDGSSSDKFAVGCNHWSDGNWRDWMVVSNTGVGIKTSSPAYPLDVNGTIRASEVKIEIASGADFVFESDYELRPLPEVETFVKENKHLPEIPSEKQMQEEGVSVNDLQIKLLQKIEELTLYVIEQDKEIKTLKNKIDKLENN